MLLSPFSERIFTYTGANAGLLLCQAISYCTYNPPHGRRLRFHISRPILSGVKNTFLTRLG